uniref:Uncharacterized protein n=1 Tax=Burkholderia cepacia TaxID=292 RepID=J9S1J7_BURCE|nr:hypothetical protein [Burkholderia cepacia]AFR44271.1 conserved hypothetical protein [Burkholderia cepacia]
MTTAIERILILAKTYPSPSAKHTETSCVAGINECGESRRLYPVPFRLIAGDQQFKKWQWITVRIEKSPADHRPESHRVFVDTIQSQEVLTTDKKWAERRVWLDKLPIFDSFAALEACRELNGISLALLRPKRILGLTITPADNAEWTDDEMAKLLHDQMQGNLFEQEEERKQLKLLKKLPFDFYYRYVCDTPEGEVEGKHKIVDWEAGMLFWNCKRKHGDAWEAPFRAKLEADLAEKMMFFMGNIHRFQHQWLIISLIYPPKQMPDPSSQAELF